MKTFRSVEAGRPSLLPALETLPELQDVVRKNCLLCGRQAFRQPYPDKLPWLFRCKHCRLGFTNPQPTDGELAQIYSKEYYQTFGASDAGSDGYSIMQRVRFTRLLRMAERLVGVGRLLDAGSALGDLLRAAAVRGWIPQGVEPNAFACQRANQTLAGFTWHGKIEDYVPQGPPYDLVTCLDVLEHLRRPDQLFFQAARWLQPGGVLLVTTVNEDSFLAHWLGRRWVHYHRDHLWYFTPRTLRALAEAAGLQVLRCSPAQKAFNASYILEILSHGSDASLVRRLTNWGLKCMPRKILNHVFSIKEGLLLLARRPLRRYPPSWQARPFL